MGVDSERQIERGGRHEEPVDKQVFSPAKVVKGGHC
jgi:hypothetical protein